MRKISVTEIIHKKYPYYLLFNSDFRITLQKEGLRLHKQKGFQGIKTVKKAYKNIVLSGKPDLINNDIIIEFKGYVPQHEKIITKSALAQLDLYGFITGLKKSRLILFNFLSKEEKIIEHDIDFEKALSLIDEYLRNIANI